MTNNTNLSQDAEEVKKAQKYKDALSCIRDLCLEEREMCCGECGNYNVAERILNIIEPALNSIDGAAEGVTAK